METNMVRKTDTSSRITVLETQVEAISSDIIKLEEKIDNNYATLHHRISEMRDDFHEHIDEKHKTLVQKLDDHSKSSTAQYANITQKIQAIDKWRWMIMGGAVVIGYVLAHVKLERLF